MAGWGLSEWRPPRAIPGPHREHARAGTQSVQCQVRLQSQDRDWRFGGAELMVTESIPHCSCWSLIT